MSLKVNICYLILLLSKLYFSFIYFILLIFFCFIYSVYYIFLYNKIITHKVLCIYYLKFNQDVIHSTFITCLYIIINNTLIES